MRDAGAALGQSGQAFLPTRSVARDEHDPCAHRRQPSSGDLADAGSRTRNHNHLALHTFLPRAFPLGPYLTVAGRARLRHLHACYSFNTSLFLGGLYESCQAPRPRLGAFGTDDSPNHLMPISGGLRLEELPCGFVFSKASLFAWLELRSLLLLVRIYLRFPFATERIGLQACLAHPSFAPEYAHPLDIDRAPDRLRFSRREADLVGMLVDALANAVDPAEAKRCIDRLGPAQTWAPRAALVVADDEFRPVGTVFFQPGRELIGGFEEHRHSLLPLPRYRQRSKLCICYAGS